MLPPSSSSSSFRVVGCFVGCVLFITFLDSSRQAESSESKSLQFG